MLGVARAPHGRRMMGQNHHACRRPRLLVLQLCLQQLDGLAVDAPGVVHAQEAHPQLCGLFFFFSTILK